MAAAQISSHIYQASRCFFTHGALSHIEEHQVPTDGKLWKTIREIGNSVQIDLLLPSNSYEALESMITSIRDSPYFRVKAKLEDILEKKFFQEHVKTGNVSMFSKGDTFSQNTFTIQDGILTMHLDKETFERTGLDGAIDGRNGTDKCKSRWLISYNLTSNSMQHGKRGFDRLLYACKSTLNNSIEWAMCFKNESQQVMPVGAREVVAKRSIERIPNTQLPKLNGVYIDTANDSAEDLQVFATDLYEWISLTRLQSPRVDVGDAIDPYLARYQTPNRSQSNLEAWRIRWDGLIDSAWLRTLLIKLLRQCPHHGWFCLTARNFSQGLSQVGDEITIMRQDGAKDEYLMWEVNRGRK